MDAIRTSSEWAGSKKAYNPAKMAHYNALVMSKLYWLAEVAEVCHIILCHMSHHLICLSCTGLPKWLRYVTSSYVICHIILYV